MSSKKKKTKNSKKEMPFAETHQPIFSKMADNINYLKKAFEGTEDLIIEHFSGNYTIMYLETVYKTEAMSQMIIAPLEKAKSKEDASKALAYYGEPVTDLIQAILRVTKGFTLVFLEKEQCILQFNTANKFQRQIQEPSNEKIIRGSHEGFIETLNINLGLIRTRLEHPSLQIKYYHLGKYSNTKGALVYIKDLANEQVLKEIDERIKEISTDYVQSPGFVEEFIEDTAMTPFPQMLNTERPDRAMSNIMDGRIALFLEGSATAMILPVNFFAFFQSPDDYNSRWIVGSFIRFLRTFGFIISILLPSFYIAVFSFHPEVIPDALLLTVKASVNDLPFSPLNEALIMTLTLELIREAGIRLPSPIGQTIGIVGGIVIGQAVVQAGLISNVMIIVVGLTAISSYVIPSNELSSAVRIISYPLMLLATLFGFIGMAFGLIVLTFHLCSLESFGMPYFSPLGPLKLKDLKDSFVRLPLWKQSSRPADAHAQKQKKQDKSRGWAEDD